VKAFVVAAAFAVVPFVAIAATPAPQSATAKVTVAMPGDLSFAFKPGAGSQTATAQCLTCHSSAYVSTQPPLDKAHWAAEVAKMRKAYGARVSDKDADTIVDYLTATYGKP
jgi:sulfite dehydrogenase (cytochrome) subunit B